MVGVKKKLLEGHYMSIFYTKYSLKKLTFKSDLNLQQLQSCRLQNSNLQISLLVSLKFPDYHELGLLIHLCFFFFFPIYVFLKFISEHRKLCLQSRPTKSKSNHLLVKIILVFPFLFKNPYILIYVSDPPYKLYPSQTSKRFIY